jgi:hypothetical protein
MSVANDAWFGIIADNANLFAVRVVRSSRYRSSQRRSYTTGVLWIAEKTRGFRTKDSRHDAKRVNLTANNSRLSPLFQ